MNADHPLYRALDSLGSSAGEPLPVTLSPELIGLLSDQLYRSPSKAIEELVVNGFDAEADEARIFVPTAEGREPFIVVYDDGVGMTYDGLADLWRVGRRKVRDDDAVYQRKQRRQIGKFGIGKLATYAVANRVTYVTKTDCKHLAVTIDYAQFTSKPDRTTTEVRLDVRKLDNLGELWSETAFRSAIESVTLTHSDLASKPSWTVVILEDLKPKAQTMKFGRLRWVLRTAMPLSAAFELFLNGEAIESSKEDYEVLVDFDISELPKARLIALGKKTGQSWSSANATLTAPALPSGISGRAKVTRKTLAGKSADLIRSEGFFVYVRGRLVNEEDARFGLHDLSHATLNRFRADVHADDLDMILTANRESMEEGDLYRTAQALLNEVFNEARQRYEDLEKRQRQKDVTAREPDRTWVPQRLVEHPTADALTMYSRDSEGTEPDESWMYLTIDPNTDLKSLTASLYSRVAREQRYRYRYAAFGRAERIVEFDPSSATFTINQDHELVLAYADDPSTQRFLQDVVTSEAMLEVYLREAGVHPHVIGEVLERRDLLLRGLADAQMFSLPALSTYVRDSARNKHELEIAAVAGARALGFVAKHISGAGEPDGVARFTDFPLGDQTITLEAKSSVGKPSAKDIDFAAIDLHRKRYNADGCILLAPDYPGGNAGNAAQSATDYKISCWTVEQYASIIESAESRQITARQILEIVTSSFAPQDVQDSVSRLLSEPTWEPRSLYVGVVKALRALHEVLSSSVRDVRMVGTVVAQMPEFRNIEEAAVTRALTDIAAASHGALLIRDNGAIVLNVSYDELERRVEALLGRAAEPRRMGVFGDSR